MHYLSSLERHYVMRRAVQRNTYLRFVSDRFPYHLAASLLMPQMVIRRDPKERALLRQYGTWLQYHQSALNHASEVHKLKKKNKMAKEQLAATTKVLNEIIGCQDDDIEVEADSELAKELMVVKEKMATPDRTSQESVQAPAVAVVITDPDPYSTS